MDYFNGGKVSVHRGLPYVELGFKREHILQQGAADAASSATSQL